ncbi:MULTISPECIES: hypothetical protein [Gluconobacter]|uniref:Apea-like HEPN domain-containing protein n=1 Tax=Gluconobacter cadivus TaxID=2728101 RepID=A0ABR9Z0V1_9PROT|nr:MULTISPECIES: hypothetical protein [Gluconobacter]MBF0889732.1 hypothetical protein [Gluconobacter cadivus]MBS1061318.1 hypothetical protein [Gluconobacter sp. Dm-44]
MRGEFLGVQTLLMAEVFEPLFEFIEENDIKVEDLWLDILQSALPRPVPPVAPTYQSYNDDGELHLPEDLEARATYETASERHQAKLETYMDASTDDGLARDYIHNFFDDAPSEHAIVEILEKSFKPFDDAGSDQLSNAYFVAVQTFIEKFSLRYDVRRPSFNHRMSIYPTLPGLFTKMLRDLRISSAQDAALAELMAAFEETIRDLHDERSPRRMKQCIAAQFNLLEAMLSQHPNILAYNADMENRIPQGRRANTFGAMCDKAGVWPHNKVREAAKAIYGFASDYPGIRHGGNPASQLREVDMRDLLSISVILTGLSPYLSPSMDPEKIYLD